MLTFDRGNLRLNVRTVGIVCRGHHVLLHRSQADRSWSLPGGRVEFLEASADSLKREMLEELGVEVTVLRLVWIVENFFEQDGRSCHELAFYYEMAFPAGSDLYDRAGVFHGDEEGARLKFKWFRRNELEGVELYPSFLRTSLRELPQTTQHVVHRDET